MAEQLLRPEVTLKVELPPGLANDAMLAVFVAGLLCGLVLLLALQSVGRR